MAYWIIQDTSYWKQHHSGAIQINRVNLKCSLCGYRLKRNENKEVCPNCKSRMEENNNVVGAKI